MDNYDEKGFESQKTIDGFSLEDIINEIKNDNNLSQSSKETIEEIIDEFSTQETKTDSKNKFTNEIGHKKPRAKHAKNNPIIENTKNKFVRITNNSVNRGIIKLLIILTVAGVTAGKLTTIESPNLFPSEIVDTVEFDEIDEIFTSLEIQLEKNDICVHIIQEIDNYLSQENLSETEKIEYLKSLLLNEKNSSDVKISIINSVMQQIDLDNYIGVDYDPIDGKTYQKLTENTEFMQAISKHSTRFGIPEDVLFGLSMCQVTVNPTGISQEETTRVTQNNIMNINFALWNRFEETRSVTTMDSQERIMLKEFRHRENSNINNNVEYAAAIFRNCLTQSDNTILNSSSFSTNPDRPKDAFDYYFYKDTDLSELSEEERTELVEMKQRIINVVINASGNLKTTIECPYQIVNDTKISETPVVLNNLEIFVEAYYDQILDIIGERIEILKQSTGKTF